MTNNTAVRWLKNIAKKYKFRILFLVLLHIAISGGAVCYAVIMKNVVDCAVAKEQAGFFNAIIIFGGMVVVLLLLRIVLRHFEELTRSDLENTFKKRLFQAILTKDYVQVTGHHSEEWMSRMTSDTVICANGITDILPGLLGMTVKLSGALGMIVFLQPKLAYILVPCGLLFLGVTLIFRKYLKRLHKEVQEKDGVARVYMQERISSMLILRTFGVERQTIAETTEYLQEHKNARMKKNRISNLCNTGFSAMINGMYLLGIGYCGYGILNGTISYGTLTAMMQLIGQLQAPLANISGYVPRYYSMIASAERLMEIEEYPEADELPIRTLEETKKLYAENMRSFLLEDISFSYKKDQEMSLFSHVTVSIEKGDYIALTGMSGCGKSTLLKLLMGIYEPESGSMNLMTTKQQRLPVKEWRRMFAYVPQGNYLMSGTIREIITFGQEGQAAIPIERAVTLACADFIWELSEGLDTHLGEKGAGLSEGQMQRIAIARALYRDAPVLILDEATSALDEETERRFLRQLHQLTDKTVLIVTHRTAALSICKKQLVFKTDEDGAAEIYLEVGQEI